MEAWDGLIMEMIQADVEKTKAELKARDEAQQELQKRIEKARYECYKEIQALGGLYENLGDKQERELTDFVRKLNLPYHFSRELEDEVNAFIDQLERLDDNDLPEINRFIKNYERSETIKKVRTMQ